MEVEVEVTLGLCAALVFPGEMYQTETLSPKVRYIKLPLKAMPPDNHNYPLAYKHH